MEQVTIRMTLTGSFAGKTIVLNKTRFVNGVCDITGQLSSLGNILKYFQTCYQVEATYPGQEDPVEEPKQDEVVVVDPNQRQAAIIAAVNGIDKEEWIEQDTNPHPKVKDVATLMEDPTVKKEEILEVIELWLS